MVKIAHISLDASLQSTLDWKDARQKALSAIGAGCKLLWCLDFGFFNGFTKPLSNGSQFLNLGLALDHFKETLWKEFKGFSLGISLYRVSGHFLNGFLWDEEQQTNLILWAEENFKDIEVLNRELKTELKHFNEISKELLEKSGSGCLLLHLFARDVSSDYLAQLAERVPDEIDPYLVFDRGLNDLLLEMLLGNFEKYGRLKLFWIEPKLQWNTEEKREKGICLPSVDIVKPSLFFPFQNILKQSQEESMKLIPEEVLTTAWDGLNELFYSPKALSPQGKRKLQGFLAAGGHAIPLESPELGLSYG